jgi:hypothetical protein
MSTAVAGTRTTLRSGLSHPRSVATSGDGQVGKARDSGEDELEGDGKTTAQSPSPSFDMGSGVGQQRGPRRKKPSPHGTSSLAEGSPPGALRNARFTTALAMSAIAIRIAATISLLASFFFTSETRRRP